LSDSPKQALLCLTVIDLLRKWTLGRIATGSLEKEEAAGQVPAELLLPREPGQAKNPFWWRRTLAWYCGALAMGALLVLIAVRHNGGMADQRERKVVAKLEDLHAADEARWRELQAHPTLKAYRERLDRGLARHRTEAPVLAVELKHQLEDRLATRSAKGRAILLPMVNAILDGAPASICLDYRAEDEKVERGESLPPFADAVRRSSSPLKVFRAAVDEAFGRDQIEVFKCSGGGQITVSLAAQAKPTGETYELEERDGFKLAAMAIDWSLVVRLPGAEEPSYRGGGYIEPPLQIEARLIHRSIAEVNRLQPMSESDLRAALLMARVTSRNMAYERMADTLAQQAVRAAAIDLGLGEPQVITESAGPPEEVYRLTRSSPDARGREQ
jgi:hypothetical protein